MKKEEVFNLKLREAKDLLTHINDSIRETRNRMYFVLVILFAVFSYCLDDVLNARFLTDKSIVLYVLVLFMIYILYQSRKSVTPLKLRFMGMSPNNFESIMEEDDNQTWVNILYTYQRSIEVNGDHLQMVARAYNKAYYALLIWFVSTSCILILKWVIQSYIC